MSVEYERVYIYIYANKSSSSIYISENDGF